MLANRFIDTGDTAWDFGDEFLVHCPECGECARVVPRDEDASLFAPRRLVCPHCALVKEHADRAVGMQDGVDFYFGERLWLSAPCCGESLWAFNPRHLDWIESYVRATLRERGRDPESGWSNQSLASRLPRWMKHAANRDAVLKAVARIRRERLPTR
jgi:hypothetical protein